MYKSNITKGLGRGKEIEIRVRTAATAEPLRGCERVRRASPRGAQSSQSQRGQPVTFIELREVQTLLARLHPAATPAHPGDGGALDPHSACEWLRTPAPPPSFLWNNGEGTP